MDRKELHEIWAPAASVWSPWVKPVPFAFWPRRTKRTPPPLRPQFDRGLFPDAAERQALVIELPGGESVRYGSLLAGLGYRPVPVFSSAPSEWEKIPSAVDIDEVIAALGEEAPAIAAADFPADAPPAFLIDSRRQAPGLKLTSNFFDNRSALFASDFPSKDTLAKYGIARTLIVRDRANIATSDLEHALDPWRRAGLPISAIDLDGAQLPIRWPAAGVLGSLLHRVRLFVTLRPNERGGYGRFVPESSGG